jgi:hypothetical protein
MKIKHLLPPLISAMTVLSMTMSMGWTYQGSYAGTKRIGGASGDWIAGIVSDSSGNIYVAGIFQGTVMFGNDFGATDTKTSAGGDDIFVTRINADGTYGWTRRIGGMSDDHVQDITTDTLGNIHIIGSFQGAVNFGADFGSTHTKTSAGDYDIFVTRIDADGTYGWTKKIGGTLADHGNGITISSSGIYITGEFSGTVNFGADFGITDTKTSAGGYDIFVTRINANATYAWTRRMGDASSDGGSEIITNPSGIIFVAGHFQDKVNFGADFGTTDTRASEGHADIFLTRIFSDGTYGGVRRIGGPLTDVVYDITSDPWGNVYITGMFEDTVDFAADFGKPDPKTAAGQYDIFITRINASGSYGWTRWIGSSGIEVGNGITADRSGNIYVAGYFGSSLNFGADFGIMDTKTPARYFDIFVTKINTAKGSYLGTKRIGGELFDRDSKITSDLSGNVYISGSFEDTVDFGADFGVTDTKSSLGNEDIFITKMTTSLPIFDGSDFDGDSTSDAAVWRPKSGRWFIKDVGDYFWGQLGDVPVNGDYNGDETTDIAVWRPSNGRWYLMGISTTSWGTAGDLPVPGDYNGDGTMEIAVWRPSNGRWYIHGIGTTPWGKAGDFPVPCDYNGDNITDIAVWRPSNGRWYVVGLASSTWGTMADIPVPGDYDGDGDIDLAVWRPSNGRWYIKSVAGYIWGILGDIPLVR